MAFDKDKIDDVISENEFSSLDQYITQPNIVNRQPVYLKNKRFTFRVLFSNKYATCYFENCHFEKGLEFDIPPGSKDGKVSRIFDFDIYLKDCRVDNILNMSECTFEKKVRLHDCEIHDASKKLRLEYPTENFGCNFVNTKFKGLADFWKTVFKPNTIFYKTDFYSTSVFSMVTFEKNVLFTYSLLEGKSIFAKTTFKQGLDLSQAIISGDLKLFDLQFDTPNFKAPYISNKEEYQNAIDEDGVIPLENRKETFRIIKANAEKEKNYVDASRYRNYEYKTFRRLSQKRLFTNRFFSQLTNLPIIYLNKISNNYGSSFLVGLLFTLIVGVMFLSIIVFGFLEKTPTWRIEDLDWELFIQFLNPVHKMDIYKIKDLPSITYLLDFLGRIAVGYGIYQTIQAFRKFK